MSTDLLFVYGTLMSPFDHPNAKHLHAKARCLGAARMPGILYQVTWYPGATDRSNHHTNASESWVYGELWQLDTELLLTEIDRGYHASRHPTARQPLHFRFVLSKNAAVD
ncbi:MAG: gamma-glutamylcyclotransferase family protein YtfP, partial [Pseudomonadota bacterium]